MDERANYNLFDDSETIYKKICHINIRTKEESMYELINIDCKDVRYCFINDYDEISI